MGTGWARYKETHLMRRDAVLQLALAKHGGTYAAINGAFLKRARAREERRRRRRGPTSTAPRPPSTTHAD